jgi:hypothetical protein
MSRRVILAALGVIALAARAQTPRPIVSLGEFSNMRYTEEHAYGYSVQLWREGETVFGFFLASEGLAGDTPTGLLDSVKFDSKTGRLSFRAKLTMGIDARQQPSRDLFEFDGRLGRASLNGSLKHSNGTISNGPATAQRINLKKIQPDTALSQPGSYAEWKQQAGEILIRRGPKW